jgi:hypothetical protein
MKLLLHKHSYPWNWLIFDFAFCHVSTFHFLSLVILFFTKVFRLSKQGHLFGVKGGSSLITILPFLFHVQTRQMSFYFHSPWISLPIGEVSSCSVRLLAHVTIPVLITFYSLLAYNHQTIFEYFVLFFDSLIIYSKFFQAKKDDLH